MSKVHIDTESAIIAKKTLRIGSGNGGSITPDAFNLPAWIEAINGKRTILGIEIVVDSRKDEN